MDLLIAVVTPHLAESKDKATQQDVDTPHMHDPQAPGGVREPDLWELPRGY